MNCVMETSILGNKNVLQYASLNLQKGRLPIKLFYIPWHYMILALIKKRPLITLFKYSLVWIRQHIHFNILMHWMSGSRQSFDHFCHKSVTVNFHCQPDWSSWLLAVDWHKLGCCKHLGIEPVIGRSLVFLSVSLSNKYILKRCKDLWIVNLWGCVYG